MNGKYLSNNVSYIATLTWSKYVELKKDWYLLIFIFS